ncbi:DUF4268 domain-containing protein [Flavobacterium orientale]|uniref:DUF4268 domain-containing protein n=1 Tax=Flavobacterium orientale TaxID=1756020 RepID=A0A916Y955_9FLAO|nr:DUF4268 domain-containing protein [Flavobacterium orientale]GGD35420.1 hypothetical protein GCM10011343_26610 [Flavobacterium orientale]
MYSKEEAQKIKREFWIKFAEEYPRKWLLYNTKIKDFTFKFHVDNKKAMVSLDIESKDDDLRNIYFEKIESLKTILIEEYLEDVIFEKNYQLENGKTISRIWVETHGISVNNKATWKTIFDFFSQKMEAFECFFYEYQEYISDLEINT